MYQYYHTEPTPRVSLCFVLYIYIYIYHGVTNTHSHHITNLCIGSTFLIVLSSLWSVSLSNGSCIPLFSTCSISFMFNVPSLFCVTTNYVACDQRAESLRIWFFIGILSSLKLIWSGIFLFCWRKESFFWLWSYCTF